MTLMTGGKLKLVQAALRLVTASGTLNSLGLRELAREAGLNPNTFYRHFNGLEEFGLEVLEYIASDLKTGVRQLRLAAQSQQQASRETVAFVYEYFLKHPEATTVAVRELHGPSPLLRAALANQLEISAREMAEDIIERKLMPLLEAEVIYEISRMTIRYILFRAVDYIDRENQRDTIQLETERYINRQFLGAMVEHLSPEEIAARLSA